MGSRGRGSCGQIGGQQRPIQACYLLRCVHTCMPICEASRACHAVCECPLCARPGGPGLTCLLLRKPVCPTRGYAQSGEGLAATPCTAQGPWSCAFVGWAICGVGRMGEQSSEGGTPSMKPRASMSPGPAWSLAQTSLAGQQLREWAHGGILIKESKIQCILQS